MADLNANINVGIETTQALNQLKALQKQISQFHQSVAKSSNQAALAQRDLQRNFLNGVNAIQGFSAELKTVRTTAETFTNSLEKNKFSMREYFRYSAGATKTFGKNFAAEMSTIERTAIERVKTLQTQYVKMGRDATGAMQAIAIRPTVLNMKDLGTQTAIAAQKQVLFNQLVKQGSTNLLNFGKNTQWAGRQLMVGFTLPLATLGMTAGRVFFDMEKAAIKFKKVYGDLFTAPEETQKAMDSIVELGKAYSAYGVAVSDSLSVAADAAAAGFAGVDLQNQTSAALKLSVLGQLELQKALETTISLQNAFQLSSEQLAGEIDFLNAVENQTVVALDDMTEAIPRVAPVIQQLGGDVRDLAFFLAAMKEGGINAAQGANALKSGLASLINPTERAAQMLSGFGVNIRSIVSQNQGDIAGTVYDFAKALDNLDPLNRAKAIEQLFGKFQFARISALFDNITRDGTQAQRVLELAGSSAEELAALSDSELGTAAASSMNKFRSAVEKLKVALVPVGELFVQIATPFVEFGTKVLEAFNNLPGGIKTAIGTVITILGGIGPVALMTFGLINNGIANMIKFFATVRLGYLKITGQAKGVGDETQYMTQEQLEAAAAAASLDQAHAGLTQRFTAEKSAVDALRVAYQQAAAAGAAFALNYPGMMKPGTQAKGFAKGGVVSGPGTGTSDSIPALLSNGEAVIPAKQAKEYAPIIQGMIAGNLPGFAKGVMLGMPRSAKSVSKNREAADAIYEQFLKSSYANTPPTEYGHQISPTSGHSFPIFGLGGVYQKGNKRVFVKPVMDETAALAEIRGTQITRQAHGLEAPEQRIVVIRDPLDPTRQRRFLALESDLDARFIQNEPKALFNEEQYFKQLVASLLRVDKDLAAANVFGNVVADVGPAGVFDRASGVRALKTDLPSMEEQAMINLLGIKGGAKRAFAESTLALMAGLTPQQYHQRMIGEIQKVLPALKKTVADFGLSNPTEAKAYDAMIKRLEAGLGVDWSKFHAIHSKVVPAVPKKPKAVNLANGGMVRGPGGPKDDAIPANLSNGEAVIDAATVKKNPGIIAALFQKKKIQIPGYAENNGGQIKLPAAARLADQFKTTKTAPYKTNASHLQMFSPENLIATLKTLGGEFGELEVEVTRFTPKLDEFGNQIERNGAKVYESSVEMKKIKDLDSNDHALVKGTGFGGTTVLESQIRNKDAYQKAGIEGASFTLQDVVEAGDKAAIALQNSANMSDEVKIELEGLVEESRIAKQKLAQENSATEELTYSKEVARKAIYEATQKDTSNSMTDQEARAHATRQIVEAEQAHARRVADGMDEQESLRLAQKELAAKMFLASQRVDQSSIELVAGPEGTMRDLGRKVAQFGPNAIKSDSKHIIDDPSLVPNTSRGRNAALVAARIVKAEEAEALAANEGFVFGEAVNKLFFSHVRKGLGIESPSKEFSNISNEVAAGVREAGPEAKKAGEVLGETVATSAATQGAEAGGPRRYSSDPLVMAALAGRSQAGANTGSRSGNGRSVRQADMNFIPAPLMSRVPYGPQEDPERRDKRIQAVTNRQIERMNKLSSSVSTAAMGMSVVSGALSMFGGEMSAVTSMISMVTGGMFVLLQATQALTASQGAAALMNKVNAAGGIASFFNSFRGVSKGLTGFGKGISGVYGAISKAFPIASKLVPVLGLVLTAFSAFTFISDIIQKQKQKVEGLGNAAAFSSDQLKSLGQKLNADVKTIDYTTGLAVNSGGQTTTEQEKTSDFLLNPEFKVEYADAIAGIKDATKDQAERALSSLATQLVNSGFEKDTADAIIAAIVQSTERTDLRLKFNSIKIDSDQSAADVVDSIAPSLDAFNNVNILDGGTAPTDAAKKEAEVAAGAIKASFDSLTLAFNSGLISLQTYETEIANLFGLIESSQAPRWLLDLIAGDMGIGEFVGKLDTLEAKTFAIQAAVANIKLDPEDQKILEDGSRAQATAEERKAATDVMEKYADAIATAAENQEILNKKEQEAARQEVLTNAFEEQKLSIENNDAAYQALTDAGLSAADAIGAVGNAAFMEAFALAATDAERQNLINQYKELIGMITNSPFEQAKARSGGGSNPIQEAIKSLKEQRQEILNTSAAYSQLRRNGMSAADSFKFAQNPELMSAMNAGLKVGSARWNEIIGLIKEAEAATKAWQNSTVQGKTEQFEDVYNRVMDLFDAEEAVLDAAFESATRSDNRLIDSLQEQIDVLNRRVEDYSRDLDGIAEKEEAINKTYDEKVRALEETKKINEDILRQQKSQLSIADALSQGDIAAAASAIQESREANAAAALGAQGNMLQLSREAELANVKSPGGLTRVQIEEKIKQLKKDISTIEFGALRDAQDRVTAAEKELEAKKEALTVAGTTRTHLEAQKDAIDLARARAEVYDSELQNALANVEGIVSGWKSLDTTITTTHVVNTINTSSGTGAVITTTETQGTTLTRAEMISKAERELSSLRQDLTRAETSGRTPPASLLTQIRNKQNDIARLKYQGAAFASGGYISGPGTATSDSIPAMLSDGEYVIKAAAVNKFGKGFLDAINSGNLPGFKMGGMIIPDKGKSSKATPPKTPINIRAAERATTTRPIGKSAQALVDFIKNPMTGYSANLNKTSLEAFVNKNTIPAGLEMYRALTPGELSRIKAATDAGLDYKPGQVRSFGGSSDLQTLGDSMSSKGTTRFGGANDMARTIAQITAMENLKGIQSVNRFGSLSQLNQEGLLGPNTRYKLLSSTPGTATTPGVMRFGAYLRALGPIGYLPDIFEMGNVFSGRSSLLNKPQFQFAKGGMVKPSYFAGGGMVKPSYYSNGGFAKGTDTVPAMLTPGEFIMNRNASRDFGPLLSAINNGGGSFTTPVYPEISRTYPSANIGGGLYSNNNVAEIGAPIDNSVYNYSLSVNVAGTNATPDQIANVVMRKLQGVESQRVRGQVVR